MGLLTAVRSGLHYLYSNRLFSAYFNASERRLIAHAIVIGAVVWAVVYVLKLSVHWTFQTVVAWTEAGPSVWLIFVPLTLGALAMTFFSRYRTTLIYFRESDSRLHPLRDVEGDGLERAIVLYYTSEPALEQALLGREGTEARWQLPTFSLALRKCLATLVTLGSGASGGLTASVSLIGESIAAGLFKPRRPLARLAERVRPMQHVWTWWRSNGTDDLQTAQLCGIAAAVATLLGAPFASAFFAVEVMYRRRPVVEKLLYALLSALIAFFLTTLFFGHITMFNVERFVRPPETLGYYGILTLLAVMVSQMGVYFSWMRARISRFFRSGRFNDWQRNLIGFLSTGLIGVGAALLTGQGLDLVLGTGDITINAALAGELTLQVALVACVAKILATLATIGSGGSAGLLIPSIFLGSMIASALATTFDLVPIQLVIPAMTASLVSIVNVPIAATLVVVELFGSSYLVPSLYVLVLTLILTHNSSIYRTQREYEEKRAIWPGYSVRRVVVQPVWQGKTVAELRIRSRFGLNVIGVMEQHQHNGHVHSQLSLNPNINRPLQAGDVLLLLGEDELLDQFEAEAVESF